MAGLDETAIANLALYMTGDDPIANVGTDSSKRGKACRFNLEFARDAVFSMYDWNACRRRALLQPDVVAPAFEFNYQFVLPTGTEDNGQLHCLRVRYINDERNFGLRYKVEGRKILTNDGDPLKLKYSARVPINSVLDPLLGQVIAARLALAIAPSLSKSAAMIDEIRKTYVQNRRDAAAADAQEGTPDGFGPEPLFDDEPSWGESRL